MKCEQCGHENPEGVEACEQCGQPLAAAGAAAAQQPEPNPQPDPEPERPGTKFDPVHSEQMLHEAFRLSDEGKLDDAIAAAEEAVAANPGSTSAHSVLGTLLHRKGEINRAVQEYEAVLALSPESGADRARLEQVLGIRRRPVTISWPLAVAMTIFAAVIIISIWSVSQRANQPAVVNQPVTTAQRPTVPAPAPRTARTNQLGPPPAPASAAAPAPRATATPTVPALTSPLARPNQAPAPAPTTSPRTRTTTPAPVVAPVIPVVPTGTTLAAAPPSPEQSERLASNYYWQRDYGHAVQAYEQAISHQTNPPPRLHQDAAWCYLKLGRGSDAMAHYQAAIDGYHRQIAEGRNREAAEHGLRTCQAALRTLIASTP